MLAFITFLIVVLYSSAVADQLPNSDIVVFDIERTGNAIQLSNPTIVANSPGYDNQPFFAPDSETVFFSRIDGENSDIWAWSSDQGARNLTQSSWSEYSPTVIPFASKLLSTVVVEEDGTQRLWSYSSRAGYQLLFPELQPVGYHVWSGEQAAFFVLGEPHQLRVGEWGSDQTELVDSDIGRCLQKVPGRHAASFTKMEGGSHRLKVYDFRDSGLTTLRALPKETQDYAWLNGTAILCWDGTNLVRGDADGRSPWTRVPVPMKLNAVTRLAISPDGSKLAVVYEPNEMP
jgi:WD40 repeat protein